MKFLKAMALLITLTATTQSYAAGESCAEFLKTDKELNDTYKEIQTKYKADSIFLKKLKKAQNAWIAFRDAHLEAVYPAENKAVEYGSIYRDCSCIEQNTLTAARVVELKKWLTKVPEGESCRGSKQ